jgi:hypothetical protein
LICCTKKNLATLMETQIHLVLPQLKFPFQRTRSCQTPRSVEPTTEPETQDRPRARGENMIFDANCKIVDGLQKIAFNPIMCCAAHKRERERER